MQTFCSAIKGDGLGVIVDFRAVFDCVCQGQDIDRQSSTYNKLRPPPAKYISERLRSSRARKKSSTRIAMNDATKASVEARPTPSAPAWLCRPRWQLIRPIAQPKKTAL